MCTMNISVSEPSLVSYSRKTSTKMDEKIVYNFFDHEFTNRACPVHEKAAN